MKLVLVRHAKAVDQIKALLKNISDEQRPLTKKGKAKFESFAAENADLLAGADLYVTSEYLRARETLDIILQLNKKVTNPVVLKKITPNDPTGAFLKWLTLRKEKFIVVVSHEPFISNFLKEVLGSTWGEEKIKKGAIVELQFLKNKFKLLSLQAPEKSVSE